MTGTGSSKSLTSLLADFDKLCEEYLVQKAPGLPENIKETLVRIAPWVVIVGLVISVPGILLALGLGGLAGSLSFLAGPYAAVNFGFSYTISMVVLAISVVLEVLALPGLFSQARRAWNLMYYASLISIASNLISFNLGSALVGGLISLYLLYQLKAHYKN